MNVNAPMTKAEALRKVRGDMGRIAWLTELDAELVGKNSTDGIVQRLDLAVRAHATAPRGSVAQRQATIKAVKAAMELCAFTIGWEVGPVFVHLLAALKGLNEGKADPLLRPVPRERHHNDRKTAGTSAMDTWDMVLMAHCVGYVDALVGDRDNRRTVPQAIEVVANVTGVSANAAIRRTEPVPQKQDVLLALPGRARVFLRPAEG